MKVRDMALSSTKTVNSAGRTAFDFDLYNIAVCSHMFWNWVTLLWLFGGHQISCQSAFRSSGEDLDLIVLLAVLCAEKGMRQISMRCEVWELLIWPDLILTFCLWSQCSLEGSERHTSLCKIGGICVNAVAALCWNTNYFYCVQTI